MRCRNYWIAASISFFVSMLLTLGMTVFIGTTTGLIFTVLMLMAVVSGWVLWAIGLVNYFRMR